MSNPFPSSTYFLIIIASAVITFVVVMIIRKLRKRSGKVAKKLPITTLDFEIDGQKGKINVVDKDTFSWTWNNVTPDVVKTVNPDLAVRINELAAQRVTGYFDWKNGKKASTEQLEKITKVGVMNARIYDVPHRSRYLRHVETIPGRDYGRQWLLGTNLVFALRFDGKKLEPVKPPKSMEHPPSELYEALQTKDDVQEVLGNRSDEGDKIKLGLLVMAACVALFIMFMAIYHKGSSASLISPVYLALKFVLGGG